MNSPMLKFANSGTYVMAKYDPETCEKLHRWANANDIPAPLDHSKLHSTIMESKSATIPNHDELNRDVQGMEFSPQKLMLMPTKFKSLSGKLESALIILLNAPELVTLHQEMIARGGRHSRDIYEPHVAISYFVPRDTNLAGIPLPTFQLSVQRIIAEPIDVDWINH